MVFGLRDLKLMGTTSRGVWSFILGIGRGMAQGLSIQPIPPSLPSMGLDRQQLALSTCDLRNIDGP
jgi:hypothetical protein